MTREEEAVRRLKALQADAAQAAIAADRLASALRAGAEQDERELLSFHPDVIALDMEDAAWNPES